jgi:carbamoylphosphate synthase large subunit
MIKEYSICLTCAGGTLKKQEGVFLKRYSKYKDLLTLIGTDINSNNIDKKVFDYSYKLPDPFSKKYLDKLISVIKKHKIKLLIVCSDEEALVISKNVSKIKKLNCEILLNKLTTLEILSDKILTYKKLAKIKEIIPYWKEIKNFKQLGQNIELFLSKLGSAVVKPSVSRGGRDVFIIENFKKKRKKNYGRHKYVTLDEFNKKYVKIFKNKFPIIIMEQLFEPAYDLDIFSLRSKVINCLFRKRMTIDGYQGHKILYNKNVINFAKKIAKKLNLDSINDCDFMLNRNRKLKLLEVNPRPSGSLAVSHIAGYKILDNLLDLKIRKVKVQQSFFKKNVIITKKKIEKYNI